MDYFLKKYDYKIINKLYNLFNLMLCFYAVSLIINLFLIGNEKLIYLLLAFIIVFIACYSHLSILVRSYSETNAKSIDAYLSVIDRFANMVIKGNFKFNIFISIILIFSYNF